MDLRDIIGSYPILEIKGPRDINISKLTHDSRKVNKGDLFIAQRGFTYDGHEFITDAINKGALAIVCEEDFTYEKITKIKVLDSTDALGYFSSRFYKLPWARLGMVGITGTNGKTSIAHYLRYIFGQEKIKTAILGTMGAIINKSQIELINTTPDALLIQEIVNEMVRKKVKYCFMEVSSHALDMKRVKYMDFDMAIFTNLSNEHLDYHKNIDNYFQAKSRLFNKTKKNIINLDDPYGRRLIKEIDGKIPTFTYGLGKKADAYASNISYTNNTSNFTLNILGERAEVKLNALGQFSIYNALAASLCAYLYGIDIKTIKNALKSMETIKGRTEFIPNKSGINIVIDFCHTPDGLREVLLALKKITKGNIIVVFGAGGNRDPDKRPEMGEVVGRLADLAIISSDNPRFENPETIINDIIIGVKKSQADYVKIIDRREAIEYALRLAKTGDTILLAGKGHEEYMVIEDKKYPFSERELVLNILNNE
ncbi:MAG TPA: UDP-N-acetylmuramoyl-L-alanyl-D-glutamate--2,6-diaminopimelate ligase [Tissierellaceae bacterium]|nr:UDP-N-acetylmuramoyl-L-alanyl-D-glutamate--2,6-diaminopimelate ligase [Tissierellaceae bacterium]